MTVSCEELKEFSFACDAAHIQKKHELGSHGGQFLFRIELYEPLDWIYLQSFDPRYLGSELVPGMQRYLLSPSASSEEVVEFSKHLI